MSWTPKQEQAINIKDSDILVSAAAGSGKTAVLVERIIQKVTDATNPVDIDRFLVVTFTKAAAAQMRDKIAERLEGALAAHPESEHLSRQVVLVQKADITTIDSFCLSVVKENFSLLDIDSDYTIGDNGMLDLLKIDALDALFEECLASEDKAKYLRVLDAYGGDREDDDLKDLILRIYNTADGFSEPESWYEHALAATSVTSEEELESLSWVQAYETYIHKVAEDVLREIWELSEWMEEPDAPAYNLEALASDRDKLEALLNAKSLKEIAKVRDLEWAKLNRRPKDSACPEENHKLFMDRRNLYKKLLDKKKVPAASPEVVLEQIAFMKDDLVTLLTMAKRFGELFDAEKKKRKLMSFSDVEHMAYRLLCHGHREDDPMIPIPSEVATEIAKRYEEIYIDEYQDSNFLQEDVLMCVSQIADDVHHMFMVGDVKQSIYRFRRARPDLFLGKYNTFGEEGKQIKVELSANFRSRYEVLDSVNFFFHLLMGKDLGGIEYNSDVELVLGQEIPKAEDANTTYATELLVVDRNAGEEDGDASDDEEKVEVEKLRAEAEMIALRIKELTDPAHPQMVREGDTAFRPAQFGDIVILARGLKDVGTMFMNVLKNHDIPVVLDRGEGYFEATEIRVLMSLLSVIDNTRQDIPMAAVLLSPIAGLDENELAVIRKDLKEQKEKTLWESAELYALSNDDEIARKVNRFADILNTLREEKTRLSIVALIYKALGMTGYMDYAAAMPQGEARVANIRLLIEKAKQYEQGIYKGLFDFLRYLEKLKFTGGDMGADGGTGDVGNAVSIMTMHKSKGLEFPIVFVSALGKGFNMMDSRPMVLVHSDHYLAGMLMYTDKRYRKESVIKNCFKILFREETLAEELRVLYVAMTRAKEKLILTGCMDDLETKMQKFAGDPVETGDKLPFSLRYDAKCFLDWILAVMVRNGDFAPFRLENQSAEEVSQKKIEGALRETPIISTLAEESLAGDAGVLYDRFRSEMAYVYPYTEAVSRPGKLSVSEIKRMKEFDGETYEVSEEYDSVEAVETAEATDAIPETEERPHTDVNLGAKRGTAVHKFMELLDFAAFSEKDTMKKVLEAERERILTFRGMSEEDMKLVYLPMIGAFLASDLGSRMIAAAKAGKLYREKRFSVGIPARKIYKTDEGFSEDDYILVQGIIDAYFEEDGDLVLMDYKTDHADGETLLDRYKAQLICYGETLEGLSKKKVKEQLIYGFFTGETIPVE